MNDRWKPFNGVSTGVVPSRVGEGELGSRHGGYFRIDHRLRVGFCTHHRIRGGCHGIVALRKNPRLDHGWRNGRIFAKGGIVLGFLLFTGGFFAAPTSDLSKAKKVTALATETAIESSLNNFHIEYGALPKVPAELKTNTSDGLRLLATLLGVEESATPENVRGIKFLSVKEGKAGIGGKGGKHGLVYNPSGDSVVGLYDPWRNPYTVVTDQDGDGKLQFSYGSITKTLKGRRVVAYSPGADGKAGTNDDVTSW